MSRKVKLKTWALNNSVIDIAEQCEVSRQTIHNAINSDRTIMLEIDNDRIVSAMEITQRKKIWRFEE